MIRFARAAVLSCSVLAVAACKAESEAAMRERLDGWFALGDTLSFVAQRECTSAAFALVDGSIGASMPVEHGVPDMLRQVAQRGAAAFDHRETTPDAAMINAVNVNRALGMQMRRAALEARNCMDDAAEVAFRAALENPDVVIAFDSDAASIMLLDRQARRLLVAKGAGA